MKKLGLTLVFVLALLTLSSFQVNKELPQVSLNSDHYFITSTQETVFLSVFFEETKTTHDLYPDGQWYVQAPSGKYVEILQSSSAMPEFSITENNLPMFSFENPPDSMEILDPITHSTYETFSDYFMSLTENGAYPVTIIAEWLPSTERPYHGALSYDMLFSVTLNPQIQLLTDELYPGNILALALSPIKEHYIVDLSTNLSHGLFSSFNNNGQRLFFIPIDIWSESGFYDLSFHIQDPTTQQNWHLSKTLSVDSKNFVTQYLYIDEQIYEETTSDEAYVEFRQRAQEARRVSDPVQHWEGPFIMPVKDDYVLTTDFAEIRYVNDEITSSRHSGLDLAAPTGTPIYACNHGRIALSEYLILTGNTIVIDHGFGLFTSYYHLDTLAVDEDDFVLKGDYVGTMGSTGFSTGPHLHWSISVYNTYVNTWQVTDSDFLP